jgi:hypothetical protein
VFFFSRSVLAATLRNWYSVRRRAPCNLGSETSRYLILKIKVTRVTLEEERSALIVWARFFRGSRWREVQKAIITIKEVKQRLQK